MGIILPFDDKMAKCNGAFIDCNGKVLYTNGEHEEFAKEYCVGHNYEYLRDIKLFYLKNAWKHYHSLLDYIKKSKEINEFCDSKLTEEQRQLYQLWVCREYSEALYADFMVFVLGFDKVERIKRNTIVTANPLPHVRLYNYYLMDWNIDCQLFKKYNYQTGEFESNCNSDWGMMKCRDNQALDELEEIKGDVLIKDRYLFFRD